MELLNSEIDELNGPAWFMNDKEYTLDYVCVNERGLQCVKGAKIFDIEEVVESDYADLDIYLEWKKTRNERGPKSIKKKRNRLNDGQCSVFSERVKERECKDMSELINVVIELGSDINAHVQEWKEKRMGWMNDRVVENIERRKSANRNYRRTRKAVGVNDHRAKEAKEVYERCKKDGKICVQDALHVHNKRVMREISEAGNKKGLYKRLNGLIHKGKVCVSKKLVL